MNLTHFRGDHLILSAPPTKLARGGVPSEISLLALFLLPAFTTLGFYLRWVRLGLTFLRVISEGMEPASHGEKDSRRVN